MIPAKNILKSGYFMKSEDAITEVLDFVVILGILLLSFSMIGLAGYPILRSAQETRYIENTRQSFIVMADNINKVAMGDAPSQSMDVKMYGGSLSVTRDGTIKINATNSTNKEINFSRDMGNIQNSIGDTVVAYEGTVIWVKYSSGVILNFYKPLITNQSNVLIIPVVEISGLSSISGNGLSRVRVEGEPTVTFWSNVSNITITVKGNFTSGWDDYFRNMKEMKWDVDSDHNARLNSTKKFDVYILSTQMYAEIL